MPEAVSVKRRVVSAVGWAAFTRFAGQAINWAMTLAVIRFLRPEDYGLMALTTVVLTFFDSVSAVGLSDALVQSNRVTEAELRSVFGLILTVNVALMAVICLVADPIAGFYHEPRLMLLLVVASGNFLLVALLAIPRSHLQKALDLKRASRVEVTANVLSGLLVLAFAWRGFGVWSLLIGMLFGTFVRAVGFQLASPYLARPSFHFRGIGHIATFGGIRTLEQIAWTVYMSADIFIVGRLLTPAGLGEYSVARSIAEMPIDKLATVVKPVAFPAFALVQGDREQALGYLLKAIQLLAIVAFPLFFGLSAIAPEFTAVVLGPQWQGSTLPLQILALAMPLRVVGLVMPSFLQGLGHVRASLGNTLFGLVVLTTAFAIGCQWGVVGVCIAWLVGYPIQFLNIVRRIAILTGVPILTLLRPLGTPLFASVFMYLGLYLLRAHMPMTLPPVPKFAAGVVIGALLFFAYFAVFGRTILLDVRRLVRG